MTSTKPKLNDEAYKKETLEAWKVTGKGSDEPINGHLKTDFWMAQNYLFSEKGIQISAFMAATAWNLKKMMEKLKRIFLHSIFLLFLQQKFKLSHCLKMTF